MKNSLAEGMMDVFGDLSDANLLADGTLMELNHAPTRLHQVEILFRVLNGRSRDAVLIRSFQRAISRVSGMGSMLKEGLINQ